MRKETLYQGGKAYLETLDGIRGCRIDQIFTVGIIKWYQVHLVEGEHATMTCRRKDLMSRRELERRRDAGLSR